MTRDSRMVVVALPRGRGSERMSRAKEFQNEMDCKKGREGWSPRRAKTAAGARKSNGNGVANTAVAATALLHAGSTPTHGEYHTPVLRAVDFVLRHVDEKPRRGFGNHQSARHAEIVG
jgi:hypothetical protein